MRDLVENIFPQLGGQRDSHLFSLGADVEVRQDDPIRSEASASQGLGVIRRLVEVLSILFNAPVVVDYAVAQLVVGVQASQQHVWRASHSASQLCFRSWSC